MEPNPLYGTTDYLLALPQLIYDAEKELMLANLAIATAKEALKKQEGALLQGKDPVIRIDGKNVETREAQLRDATKPERQVLQTKTYQVQEITCKISHLYNQFRAYETVAQLRTQLRPAS